MTKPELTKKWWTANRPEKVKGPELERALGALEQADGAKRVSALETVSAAVEKVSNLLDEKADKELLKGLKTLAGLADGEAKKAAAAAKAAAAQTKEEEEPKAETSEDKMCDPEILRTTIRAAARRSLVFGFAIGGKPEQSVLALNVRGSPDAMLRLARKKSGLPKGCCGTAQADENNPTLLNLALDGQLVNGLVRAMRKYFEHHKITQFRKIRALVEGKEVEAEGSDDAPEAAGQAATSAPPPPGQGEKTSTAWDQHKAEYESAVKQVEELQDWGTPAAATLRALIDGISAEVKQGKFVQAIVTLDRLRPKLGPLFQQYQGEKKKYESLLDSAQKAIKDLNTNAQKANFTTELNALETKCKEAQAKRAAKDLEGAVKLLQGLVSDCAQTKTAMAMVAKGLTKARAGQVADISQSLVNEGVDPDKALEVGQLTNLGGHGDIADAKLVAKELTVLPKDALKTMNANGTKVVACRGSITDYKTNLKGVTPRGWPAGSTWDSVPGVFMGDSNEVVVATTGHGTKDGAKVPPTGHGHGAFDLAAHESMHGYDLGGKGKHKHSDKAFVDARQKDLPKLGAYFTQAGEAGLEETFAESAARYFGKDPKMKTDWPNLYKYWDSQPK